MSRTIASTGHLNGAGDAGRSEKAGDGRYRADALKACDIAFSAEER